MSANDQYALNWSNHMNYIRKAFDALLAENQFVDVTLSCEGKKVSAHKVLLSACSTYFHDLFRDNPCQHPIVILRDVKFQNLTDILKFMYSGEVSVAIDNFDSFLKTAELLQVSGLIDDENKSAKFVDDAKNVEITEQSAQYNVSRSLLKKKINQINEELPKKRLNENASDEEYAHKKKKEEEVHVDFILKEEPDETLTLDESHIQVSDPLEIEQNTDIDQNTDTIEGMDMIEPTGSQKFTDVQELLNVSYPVAKQENCNTQCLLCDKRFSHPLSLRQHMPVHLGNTRCPICQAVLSRKYHLKLHMRTRHNV